MKRKLYNSDKVSVLPDLPPGEKFIEGKMLANRYGLFKNNGVDKKHLKMRVLKLYKNNQLVTVDSLLTLKLGL